MSLIHQNIDRFMTLFSGNPNNHGVHVPDKTTTTKGVKLEGKSWSVNTPVTKDHYIKHLAGEKSLGIVVIKPNNCVDFAAIDVDIYDNEHYRTLQTIRNINLPLVGFRSKSGGLHLFFFFKKEAKAEKVVSVLRELVQILGFKPDTEIFPKQTVLTASGSWINIPYFNAPNTARYALDFDGKPLDLKEGLDLCEATAVTITELCNTVKKLPLSKAPPCLQTMFINGDVSEGHRNDFLFNCAIYLKDRFGKDFSTHLHSINLRLSNSLPEQELNSTVIKSHTRGDYTYNCKASCLTAFCNRKLCHTRKYGKASNTISNFTFEQLIRIMSDPPYYIWKINGKRLLFNDERELLSQQKFRELTMRQLNKVPKVINQTSWDSIINRALENIVEEDGDNFSMAALFKEKVIEYFNRTKAVRKAQIEDGGIWVDKDIDGDYYVLFKAAKLLQYLSKDVSLRSFTKPKMREKLKEFGIQFGEDAQKRYRSVDGRQLRACYVTLKDLAEQGIHITPDRPYNNMQEKITYKDENDEKERY